MVQLLFHDDERANHIDDKRDAGHLLGRQRCDVAALAQAHEANPAGSLNDMLRKGRTWTVEEGA